MISPRHCAVGRGWSPRLLVFLLLLLAASATRTLAQPTTRESADPDREQRRLERMLREARERSGEREEDEEHEDIQGREEWFAFQRSFPYEHVPVGARAALVEQTRVAAEAMARSTSKAGRALQSATQRWEPIGPFNVSGRIRTIAIDPRDSRVIYVGAASGGIWKTIDGGTTWTTSFDTLTSLSACAIAFDPADPNTLLVGTGENFPTLNEVAAYMGDGIFRSTDAGATWHQTGLRGVGGFSAIGYHHTKPGVVYAGAMSSRQPIPTGGGFYRSTDGGLNWTRTSPNEIYCFSVDPRNNDHIIATSLTGVTTSNDGGLTWQSASTGMSLSGAFGITVAFAPSDGSRVYALVNYQGSAGRLYASTDGGATWSAKPRLQTEFFRNQGYYNNWVAVHPDDPNVVLIAGIDIFQSIDGGQTWLNSTQSYSGGNVHPDQHIIVFDSSAHDRVLIGNDGGLYESGDAGLDWEKISLSMPTAQFYKMDVDPFNADRVAGGTQDNGSWGSLFDNAGQWNNVGGGDGFWCAFDQLDPNILYTEIYYGDDIYRVDASSGGVEIRSIVNDIEQQGGDQGLWSSPLASSAVDRGLYSARRDLWRTYNEGVTWERLEVNGNAQISALALSQHDARVIAIGTAAGQVKTSIDAGSTWRTASGLPSRYTTEVRIDPVKTDRVYAVYSGFGSKHVYRSDDGGLTFTSIDANLPDGPVNTIAVDPYDNTHLFVGTDAGAWVSIDNGASWFPFNRGLPLAPIVDLKVSFSSRLLIAATHGRSMFRTAIDAIDPAPLLVTPTGGERVQTPNTLDVRWRYLNGPVRVKLSFDGGRTWPMVQEGVTGESTTFTLGRMRTDEAMVRIEETTGILQTLQSDLFSLTTASTITSNGNRGFHAEALAVRGNEVWVSTRAGDSLYRLRLPLLSSRQGLALGSGIAGHIIDMAWRYDELLALSSDGSGARHLYALDSTGTVQREITVAGSNWTGVDVLPDGIALVAPLGEVKVIDSTGGDVRSVPASGTGAERFRWSGAARDSIGLAQISTPFDTSGFATELFRYNAPTLAPDHQGAMLVPADSDNIYTFGLTWYSEGSTRFYLVTDTAGVFYKIPADLLAGLNGSEIAERGLRVSFQPNPLRERGTLHVDLTVAGAVRVELLRPDGSQVTTLSDERWEAGPHDLSLSSGGLAAGLYYVAVRTDRNERKVVPLVIVR